MTTAHIVLFLMIWFISFVLILVVPSLRKRMATKTQRVRTERRQFQRK